MVDVTIYESRIVPIPEPDWCVDPHGGAHRFTDLTHNGPETVTTIDTRLGPIDLLRAWISHAPYLESGAEPYPVVTIEVDEGAHDFDAEDVQRLTAAIRARADELDALAAQALRLRGEDG